MATQFEEKVWSVCRNIPSGKVTTYSKLAKKIGLPKAARAVGSALNKSPGMPAVPCHRIVLSDGRVGGFNSGSKKKIALLEKEGVRVEKGKVDLEKFGI